jgi:L-threonylcarbamoyladenylate synthase
MSWRHIHLRPLRSLQKSLLQTKITNRSSATMALLKEDPVMPIYTRILPVDVNEIGTFEFTKSGSFLHPWTFQPSGSNSGANLIEAADALHTSLKPVAFPTETVYGLGANALSSAATRGIYAAKQRPADNPLIVHISSLQQLQKLLNPLGQEEDNIPEIYLPLIEKFWPGPLSILLPIPEGSRLAPEVTAGQPTFAARMPSNKLALALIQLSGLPLAAPSANASTRPSPTAAHHVAHDLDGRIEIILDGGPCNVGVESTVVDGLSSPPCILRPGGISIQDIRACKGWENVVVAYKDRQVGESESEDKPRAPGMKYKHYSPTAKVVLVDAGVPWAQVKRHLEKAASTGVRRVGIVRTLSWIAPQEDSSLNIINEAKNNTDSQAFDDYNTAPNAKKIKAKFGDHIIEIYELSIGPSVPTVARGLFSALRELDLCNVEAIFVEGIEDQGDAAAAVMNRLSKAASERFERL